MLQEKIIAEIAEKAARANGAQTGLERIFSEPATDSEGNEALRITLVLTPQAARSLTGDEALDLLVAIQQSLQQAGEERFPIVEYATELELQEEKDDPEDEKQSA